MLEGFLTLGWRDVLLAACIAYVIFSGIRLFQRLFLPGEEEMGFEVKNMDMVDVYEKCKELFPIQSLTFHGREFTRGMRVKVTTIHKKIIEGELIGINKINLICIRTHNQIVAHQLEKIDEIKILE